MYDAIVIGAGNGGLTSGATLARAGAKTLVLERHNIPGGCATSFVRGRFEFEVALHQLSGLGPPEKPGPLRGLLDNLGVTDKLEFVPIPDLYRLCIPGKVDITLPPEKAGAVAELQQRFPHEKDQIAAFFDLLYLVFMETISAFYLKDPNASKETYPLFFEYALKDAQEVLDAHFKDPLLKAVLSPYWTYIGLPPRKMSFVIMAAMFFAYMEFLPYHLKGGSQAMSTALSEAILAAGGEVRYNCGVEKILMENGKAMGVRTESGEEIAAKAVISNASKVTTYVDMMDPGDVPQSVTEELKQCTISQSAFTIYLGFDCEPGEIGVTQSTNFLLPHMDADRMYAAMKTRDITAEEDAMVLSCYNLIDPDFAPPGASQMALVTLKYGDTWTEVPPEQYAAEKYRVAEGMIAAAERFFPGMRERIEEMEIATPLTHMRYLGTPRGAVYGFDHLIKDGETFIPPQPEVPGLFGAGGWVGYNGFQTTLESGVNTAREVLAFLGG